MRLDEGAVGETGGSGEKWGKEIGGQMEGKNDRGEIRHIKGRR